MFQRVLVCTDFHDGIQRLTQFIPELAASGLQKLTFLHCVPLWEEGEIPRPNLPVLKQAEERLQQACQRVESQIPDSNPIDVTWEVRSGSPNDNIMQVAEALDVDALILGSTTRNFLTEKLFGSTTATLAHRLHRPLLTLRPQLISTYTQGELALRCQFLFRYLLLPFDGSVAGQYLVQQVKHYVQRSREMAGGKTVLEQCLLLWIIDDAARRVPQDYHTEHREEQLAAAQAELQALGLTVTTEIRRGEPLRELLDAAMNHDISAIAVSSRKANALLDWSVPSFGNEVMRQSWHPVLFFPPQP
ncbi:universal stress protein [Prochlorothrix hollandica]|uniref:universal stress protein n=1 Tax=Prochlorothrix hollandica TaxID=1223 RepID=UPI000344B0A3|nr:universal stress protein [Prochlorothrix hollandica]